MVPQCSKCHLIIDLCLLDQPTFKSMFIIIALSAAVL